MVILITGPYFVGKTILAQKILEKYKYSYMSIDHLKMGLIRSGNTHLRAEDDDKLTEYLWPIVREITKTAVENHQNLIIEGGYIPFNWRKDFDNGYLSNIHFICLAMTDKYIETNFAQIKNHCNDLELRQDTTYLTIKNLKDNNHIYINGCKANNEHVTIIDENYEKVISSTLNQLFFNDHSKG